MALLITQASRDNQADAIRIIPTKAGVLLALGKLSRNGGWHNGTVTLSPEEALKLSYLLNPTPVATVKRVKKVYDIAAHQELKEAFTALQADLDNGGVI